MLARVPHPAWEPLRDAVVAAHPAHGKDFNMGRRVPRLLRDACLADVRARAAARVTGAGAYRQTFLPTMAGLVRDQILAGEAVTAADRDAQIEGLRAHLARQGTLTCQPTMRQAWGIKP
jgi:hypothetical protein